MGQVLPFSRGKYRVAVSDQTTALLAALSGSLEYMWRGGWAELSPTGGVAVIRHGHFLGVWVHQEEGFSYHAASGEGPPTVATDIAEAYQKTLEIVGTDASEAQTVPHR
jgi:hypothetical protein